MRSTVGKLVLAASRFAKAQGFAENGYRCVINCNRDGGQTVFHLHLHLLAGPADALAAGLMSTGAGAAQRLSRRVPWLGVRIDG